MANRFRGLNQALRNWGRLEREIGEGLRSARIVTGATQQQVADAVGVSASEISRRELGKSRGMTGAKLAVHAAAVGLKLWVRFYPAGGGVRDAAQARYIAAFIARVGRRWHVTLEAVVPIVGDLRAADILLVAHQTRIVVEVITRLGDLQGQIREARAKARDLGATRLILVVADTHANSRILREARATLVPSFDLDSRRVLSEVAAGRDPGRDALVLLRARPH